MTKLEAVRAARKIIEGQATVAVHDYHDGVNFCATGALRWAAGERDRITVFSGTKLAGFWAAGNDTTNAIEAAAEAKGFELMVVNDTQGRDAVIDAFRKLEVEYAAV